MNYSELSLEERIEKAAEYAVLLALDGDQDETFLDELASMFNLTRDQAREAYNRMRIKHAAAYNKAMNEKILYAGQSFSLVLLLLTIYYFLANEVADGLYVFVILFAAGTIGWLSTVVKWSVEKIKPADKVFKEEKDDPASLKKWRIAVSFIFGGVSLLVLNYFIEKKSVREDELKEVKGVVLAENRKSTGFSGKKEVVDFYFKVSGSGHQLEFRIFPDDNPYGKGYMNSWDFSSGKVIDIMLKKNDVAEFENRYGKNKFTVYNVKLNGIWLVNLKEKENDQKKKSRSLNIFALFFIVSGLILFFYDMRQERRR